ncbi:uncharacterized protein [Miscanthus floridulus]|uniref:uncharacterized protein isoform X2 n=1 Tax=Miscanthus floridulus TaxID=154761 RepID=UPI00345A787B
MWAPRGFHCSGMGRGGLSAPSLLCPPLPPPVSSAGKDRPWAATAADERARLFLGRAAGQCSGGVVDERAHEVRLRDGGGRDGAHAAEDREVHNEGLHQIGDEDFLREIGIGCDDTGLELTQLSEITANIHCEQSALARDLEANIQSYYNFDSNIVNPNYTNEDSSSALLDYNCYGQDSLLHMQSASKREVEFNPESYYMFHTNIETANNTHESSIPPVNYSSYGQEQEMQRQEVIMSPGGTSYVLSQGGSSYTSLMNQVIAQAKSSNQNYEEFLSSEMTGSFMDILNEPFPLETPLLLRDFEQWIDTEIKQEDKEWMQNC